MSQPYRFDELRSACPNPKLSTAARLDPYWDGMWSTGSTASWVSYDIARRQEDAGLSRLPTDLSISADEAWEQFTTPRQWRTKLEMLGYLGTWRTLSAEQLAAFVGYAPLAGRSSMIPAAFGSGLIDIGVLVNRLLSTQTRSRARLHRPSRTSTMHTRLLPRLTGPERAVVTGGVKYKTGGQYDRHNLLVSELALRAAEYLDVSATMGETLSTSDHLTGTGIGRRKVELKYRNQAADATLIRSDGLRIAVEMTASVTPAFEKKVRAWANRISQQRATLNTSGLMVVFVGAPHPDRYRHDQHVFARDMRRMVARVAREAGGVPGRRVAERFAVALWEDWFPAPGLVHPDFLSLTADRPEGPLGDPWRPLGLLDPFDTPFAPPDPDEARVVINNSATIATSPYWLRARATPPPLHRLAAIRQGVTRVPIPYPRDKRRQAGWRQYRPADEMGGPLPRLSSAPATSTD